MTPDILLAVVGTFILFAVSVGWGTSVWLSTHSAAAKRLRGLVAGAPHAPISLDTLAGPALDPRLARLSKLLPRKSATQLSRLQLRLTRAGVRTAAAPIYYTVAQIALPVAFGAVTFLYAGPANAVYALGAAVVGFVLPGMWLSRRISNRQKAIRNGLPDLLDLLTLCVEAGTGLDGAITKATTELEISHPVLADETRLMTTEMRAGRPRQEAFANFAKRTGVDEVRTLVGMLAQTDRFGTSIGQALRTHAETTRTIRRQRAQERAGKLNVKLVFPLALCLFPALYLIVFGPVAVKIYRNLLH